MASLCVFICLGFILWERAPYINTFSLLNFVFMYLAIWAVSFSHEISRAKIQNALEVAAITDPLTQLKNRLALEYDYEKELKNSSDVHALYIDIDHFKKINDTYGHSIGDEVLIFTANLVEKRIDHDWIYRLGGEEFLILVKGNRTMAADVAESIRKDIEDSEFRHQHHSFSISASVGVAPINKTLGLEAAIDNADSALYQAKSEGRNRVCIFA